MRRIRCILSFLAMCLTLSLAAQTTTNLPPSPIVQFWGGGRHSIALLGDGSVWDWGSDVSGKLGDNNVSPSYTVTNNDSFLPLRVHGPGNVGYLNSIVAISAGESHNTALKSDGTVWAWGWNGLGQLGNGTTNDSHTPTQVIGVSNVVAISGRGYHCLALETDGSLWAWGYNASGQIGDGTTSNALLPICVAGVTNPASISAGFNISLVLLSNGTVNVWGTERYEEMGQGYSPAHSYSPIPVPGLSNVVSASAGFENPGVVLDNGDLLMWGYGSYGQLGDGNANDTNAPTQVIGMTNVLYLGPCSDRDACAIDADHVIWTWGRNYNGQLGIGTADLLIHAVPVPVPAFGKTDVVMVQTPDWHSLALEADSTLWAWGSDDHGQCGNGTTNESWSPVPVLWPLISAAPIGLFGVSKTNEGPFALSFTNNPGARFDVLTHTDLSRPLSQWTRIGSAFEYFPGQFQFTDTNSTAAPWRYYCVRSQ